MSWVSQRETMHGKFLRVISSSVYRERKKAEAV
jgi:hypothetical protein